MSCRMSGRIHAVRPRLQPLKGRGWSARRRCARRSSRSRSIAMWVIARKGCATTESETKRQQQKQQTARQTEQPQWSALAFQHRQPQLVVAQQLAQSGPQHHRHRQSHRVRSQSAKAAAPATANKASPSGPSGLEPGQGLQRKWSSSRSYPRINSLHRRWRKHPTSLTRCFPDRWAGSFPTRAACHPPITSWFFPVHRSGCPSADRTLRQSSSGLVFIRHPSPAASRRAFPPITDVGRADPGSLPRL